MPSTLSHPSDPQLVTGPGSRSPYATPVLVQAIYYSVTGLWAVFDLSSFQAVTGPKSDLWLVRTVGLLVTAIGVTLVVGAWRGHVSAESTILALGSAAALVLVDLTYVLKGTISWVYLLDGLVQGGLIAWWVWIAIRTDPARNEPLRFPS